MLICAHIAMCWTGLICADKAATGMKWLDEGHCSFGFAGFTLHISIKAFKLLQR